LHPAGGKRGKKARKEAVVHGRVVLLRKGKQKRGRKPLLTGASSTPRKETRLRVRKERATRRKGGRKRGKKKTLSRAEKEALPIKTNSSSEKNTPGKGRKVGRKGSHEGNLETTPKACGLYLAARTQKERDRLTLSQRPVLVRTPSEKEKKAVLGRGSPVRQKTLVKSISVQLGQSDFKSLQYNLMKKKKCLRKKSVSFLRNLSPEPVHEEGDPTRRRPGSVQEKTGTPHKRPGIVWARSVQSQEPRRHREALPDGK